MASRAELTGRVSTRCPSNGVYRSVVDTGVHSAINGFQFAVYTLQGNRQFPNRIVRRLQRAECSGLQRRSVYRQHRTTTRRRALACHRTGNGVDRSALRNALNGRSSLMDLFNDVGRQLKYQNKTCIKHFELAESLLGRAKNVCWSG